MRADDALAAGVGLLAPLLQSHGFEFVPMADGESSGGAFASGEFRRQRDSELRRLELHFRHSLGLVSYAVDGSTVSHADYMRVLNAKNEYPGFSDDPLDGFRHLLHDLERFGAGFLEGSGDEFADHAREAKRRLKVGGFRRLSEAE